MKMGEYMVGWASVMMMPLVGVAILLPMVFYIVARWRTYREGGAIDQQVGIKTALHYFQVIGFQLFLVGAFLLIAAALMSGSESGMLREGAALAISGAVVLGVHTWALTRTNQAAFPMIGRMFAGFNLVQTGIVGMVGLVMASSAVLAEGENHEMVQIAMSLLAVYGIAWLVLGVLFFQKLKTTTPDLRVGPAPPVS